MLDAVDHGRLVERVGHRLTEVDVAEPVQLDRVDEGLACVVRARILVEGQECGAEAGTPAVQREVLLALQWLQQRILLAQHAMEVRGAVAEQRQLRLQVRHHDVHDLVQVRELLAVGIGLPVVRVALEDDALLGRVLADGERAGTDDLGWVGLDVPELGERTRLDGPFENVLGVDGRAHRTQERRERLGQHELDRVIVERRHRHLRRFPLPVIVEIAELEGGTARCVEVVVVDDLVEREVHVVRCEGRAVVPPHIVTQAEHPAQPVIRALP